MYCENIALLVDFDRFKSAVFIYLCSWHIDVYLANLHIFCGRVLFHTVFIYYYCFLISQWTVAVACILMIDQLPRLKEMSSRVLAEQTALTFITAGQHLQRTRPRIGRQNGESTSRERQEGTKMLRSIFTAFHNVTTLRWLSDRSVWRDAFVAPEISESGKLPRETRA